MNASAFVRKLWLCCSVACCIAAVVCTMLNDAPSAFAAAASGCVFYLMQHVPYDDGGTG